MPQPKAREQVLSPVGETRGFQPFSDVWKEAVSDAKLLKKAGNPASAMLYMER
jgi:hypothetical protein